MKWDHAADAKVSFPPSLSSPVFCSPHASSISLFYITLHVLFSAQTILLFPLLYCYTLFIQHSAPYHSLHPHPILHDLAVPSHPPPNSLPLPSTPTNIFPASGGGNPYPQHKARLCRPRPRYRRRSVPPSPLPSLSSPLSPPTN